MPLTLYNTLTKQHEPFRPADPARVTFYTCGPTVYDDAHIGNFRSFLAADVLRRWIESPLCELANSPANSARRVVHVMNITDVGHMTDDEAADGAGEDKMAAAARRLTEAKKSGVLPAGAEVDPRNPFAIAGFYAGRFREDARKLGLKVALEADADPTLMPRATENVAGMIAMIRRLIERGHAYAVGEPRRQAVYFDVRSFPPYGRLSGNTLDRLREGAGGRVAESNQQEKRHPADFLLWKSDPSHIMKWDSPWGEGYPGWHIECSVMSFGRLNAAEDFRPDMAGDAVAVLAGEGVLFPDGEPMIDLHSGGEDNIFPHHECEMAQSCCALNESPGQGTFARLWFHPRFLLVEGEKMSKSKGNFFTPRELFAKGHEPAAVRLELIRTHYRANANFTEQGLRDSAARVRRWREHARWVAWARAHGFKGEQVVEDLVRGFAAALDDDLNIAGAIARLDELVGRDHVLRTAARPKAEAKGEAVELPELPEEPMPVAAALRLYQEGPHPVDRGWAALHLMDAVLGVVFAPQAKQVRTEIGVFAPGVEPDPRVVELLEQRRDARAAKDFKRSDEIRDELAAMGYAIKDMAGGKVEVRRA